YGATFTTDRPTRVAVVPAGYHDCVPRALSNFGHVSVLGVTCPIIGRVSMDSMMIDVTNAEDAWVGTDVVIYGEWNGARVEIEDVAEAIGTIPYEIMARVGPRVQRILSAHAFDVRPEYRRA